MDLVDYVLTLREAILEAYTGIVGAYKQSNKGTLHIRALHGNASKLT